MSGTHLKKANVEHGAFWNVNEMLDEMIEAPQQVTENWRV